MERFNEPKKSLQKMLPIKHGITSIGKSAASLNIFVAIGFVLVRHLLK